MKKVLIIDDDPFILDIYAQHLKNEHYRVDVADTSTKALEKIKNNTPDIVILDLNLGNHQGPQDGLDLLASIRHNPLTKDLKIIIMSNYNKEHYSELANISHFGVAKNFLKIEVTPKEIALAIKEILK